jgi:hypothetical protein
MKAKYPTKDELTTLFEYKDGQLWKKIITRNSGRTIKGKLIPNKINHNKGYCKVHADTRHILYHVIVWVLINGGIPDGMCIDHINGDKVDNRIENLRLVSNRKNLQNQKLHREGKLVGASLDRRTGKWRSFVRDSNTGNQLYLGTFKTEQEAHYAYRKFLQERGVA